MIGSLLLTVNTMKPEDAVASEQILGLLNKLDFFQHFSSYEKKRLAASHTSFVKFAPAVTIIEEGEIDSCFYIILSGSVVIMKRRAEMAKLQAGEFFGEMAFLADTVRTSSVIAEDDVIAVRIDKELMQQLSCDIREKIKDQCILKFVEIVTKLTERLRVRM